jgi:hypothetical protein
MEGSEQDRAVRIGLVEATIALGNGNEPPKQEAAWIEWAGILADLEMVRGFQFTGGELAEKALQERRGIVTADLFDLSGLTATQPQTSPPIWGDERQSLVLSQGGRPTLVFGNDGAGKTNLAGRIVAGALGEDRTTLLALPITPLPEDLAALVLAFDGPHETRQSFARFGLTPSTDRFTFWAAAPPWNPDEADGLTLASFVEAIEDQTGERYGLVVIDNAQRAYGDVSTSLRGTALGNALNRLEADGRSVIVTAQSKKNSRPTSKDDAMLSSMGHSGIGSSLSLYREQEGTRDGSKPTRIEMRHHKGAGSDSSARTAIEIDLPTGNMRLADDKPSEALLKWLAKLPDAGTFTRADAEEATGAPTSTAQRHLADGEAFGLIEGAGVGARSMKYYRRAGA